VATPVGPDVAALGRLLEERYGVAAPLHPLQRNDIAGRGVFRLNLAGGDSWVVRAYAHDPVRDRAAWLADRAGLLRFLEQRAYPAPRLVRPAGGGAVASGGGWDALVTTFVAGRRAGEGAAALAAMAERIARLHALRPAAGGQSADPPLPDSWWEPAHAIPYAQRYLQRTQTAATSAALGALRAAFAAALERARRLAGLESTVIHGDCWSGNAVWRGDGPVFIDWDSAGRGPAVLDLASLLVTSQPDARLREARPDSAPVEAIIRGYERGRRLPPADLDALPDAIGFIAAWHGARQFSAGPLSEAGAEHFWLTKQRGRLASAERLAALARRATTARHR